MAASQPYYSKDKSGRGMRDGCMCVCVYVCVMGYGVCGQCALEKFIRKKGALAIREHFDWSFWLVIFNVPSAVRTPSKVNKSLSFFTLFLSRHFCHSFSLSVDN